MGANSKIEWCDHSWNPWQGCIKVSPGCQHCYAETLSKRWGKDIWGPGSKRERTSAANWRLPLRWNKQAEKEGKRYKVFCASMADVFEDNDQLIDWRLDLFDLVKSTPMLDWQILTKRPDVARLFFRLRSDYLLPNVWMGTSVENQEYADKRISELLKIPAAVRFLSVEPLLGSVNLMKYLLSGAHKWRQDINWVIVGGESGPGARPMHPDWARKIRDDCQAAGVAFFFKQHGNWIGGSQLGDLPQEVKDRPYHGKLQWMNLNAEFDPEFSPREGYTPNAWADGWDLMSNIGKHAAGRLLDGRTWDEFPKIQSA